MMNAFPTSDAYHSFESLFGSCETKSIVRKWQPEVTADDEGVEIFTQSYPLLEQASGDAWTLQELELVDENAGLNGSQQGDASFVAVRLTCIAFRTLAHCQFCSTSQRRYIRRS